MSAQEDREEKLERNELCVARWRDYGFDEESWEKYNLRDVSAEVAGNLGFSNPADGIYIPYPRDKDSRIRWHRTGFAVQTVAGKYGQRSNTLPALYYPPTLPSAWQARTDIPILITEGEFKAMVVDHLVNGEGGTHRVFPVAVSGVFNWQSKRHGIEVIDDVKEIKWLGRTVLLAFDMDQNTNSMVSLALQRLVNKLGEFGAQCRVLQWPVEEGKGIDDYLAPKALPKDAWLELVEGAQFSSHVMSVIEMNERFTYCEVQQQVFDSQNNTYVPPRSFCSDFFTRKVKIQTGVKNGQAIMKEFPIGQYWLQSPLRASAVETCFHPGQKRLINNEGTVYLNTWGGWGVGLRSKALDPVKGNVQPFYDFLYATFAGEARSHVDYLVKRLAWMFQQPTQKHPTWIYLMGRPLQGKSSLIKIIASLVGDKYTANVDESIVKGQFAEWRNDKLLVTFDDSSVTDTRVIKQLLKRLTTEQHSQVNLKYVKAQTLESYFSFVFATNSVDALLDHDDRRALVLEADCHWDFAKGEWKEFDNWRTSRAGLQALLHHLMYEVKIDSEFYSEVPPKTIARELVVEVGESTWDDLVNYLATESTTVTWPRPASGLIMKWKPTVFTVDMLRNIFLLRNGETEKFKITSATLVGKLVRYGAKRCTPTGMTDVRRRLLVDGEQVSFWTWDYTWTKSTKEELVAEYHRLKKEAPELFPSSVKSKF